jgi:hypothetical protein
MVIVNEQDLLRSWSNRPTPGGGRDWGRAGGVACADQRFLAVTSGLLVPVYIDKAWVYSRCEALAAVVWRSAVPGGQQRSQHRRGVVPSKRLTEPTQTTILHRPKIRRQAKRHQVNYSFLFMRASGDQLRQIGSLIETGAIRPVLDQVFPFESTKEGMAYVEKGRAKGKVVVKVR